jgi:hypothetical protein
MDFAEVSWIRPTTREATACVWGPGAGPLLEWLGVGRDSWIQRDSVLEEHIGELRGLILVDLPDYDSTDEDHHRVADRLLPLADVLLWVTDPQKYADPALHERFAAVARAHPASVNAVVLNQIDTVSKDAARKIENALTGLLVEAGQTDPVVALTSALDGAGVPELRSWLMAQTAPKTTALRRLAAELGAAARALGEGVDAPFGRSAPGGAGAGKGGAGGAGRGGAASGGRGGGAGGRRPGRGGTAEAGQASGADGPVAGAGEGANPTAGQAPARDWPWMEQAAAAVVDGLLEACAPAPSVVPPLEPGPGQARGATSIWVAEAARHLPEQWTAAVGYALGSPANIATRLVEAFRSLELPPLPGFWARLLQPGKAARARRREWEARLRGVIEPVVDRTVVRPTQVALQDRERLGDLVAGVLAAAAAVGSRSEPGPGAHPPGEAPLGSR